MPPELRLSKSVPGSSVEGKECVRSDLGILGGKTSGYFLTSECSGYFRFISGNVLTSIIGSWSSGSQPPHKLSEFLPVYPFPVGILLPV